MRPSERLPPTTHYSQERTQSRQHPGGRARIELTHVLVIIGIIALIISIALPSIQRACETRGSVPCASNLRTVGQALLLYSLDHNGRYPQKLDELLSEGITEEVLHCAVSHQPTIFNTPGQIARMLTVDDIVAYEPLTAHDNQGSNVLWGDGHVEWLTREQLNQALSRSTTRAATRAASIDRDLN